MTLLILAITLLGGLMPFQGDAFVATFDRNPFTVSQGKRVLEIASCGPCPVSSLCKPGDCWIFIPPMARLRRDDECNDQITINCVIPTLPQPVDHALELSDIMNKIIPIEHETTAIPQETETTITLYPATSTPQVLHSITPCISCPPS